MKQLLFAILVLFIFTVQGYSQDTTITIIKPAANSNFHRNNLNLRIGPEIGWAVGDFKSTHNVGVGVIAKVDIPVSRRFSIIGFAGFKSFGGRVISNDTKYRRSNIIPIRGGINYKLLQNIYVTGQIGESTVKYVTDTKTGFSNALGLGYFNGFLDIGARWDHEYVHGGLSSINIQATYVITLGVKRER